MTAPMTDAEIREALARAEREIVGLKAAIACCPASTPPCELDTRWQDLVRLWTEERYARCAAERERYAATEAWKSSVDEWRAMSVRAETAERERDEARAAWKLTVERPTKEELRSALARAETAERERDEARAETKAAWDSAHAGRAWRTKPAEDDICGMDGETWAEAVESWHLVSEKLRLRAEAAEVKLVALARAAREYRKHIGDATGFPHPHPAWQAAQEALDALLSPQPPHTCQIHRATSGASDCGLEPCEEATVHRDRGESRPAETATPEAAKCATCGHEERRHLSEDGDGARWCDVALCDCVDYAADEKCKTCGGDGGVSRIEAVGHDEYGDLVGEAVSEPCPDCHDCGGGA